MKALKKWIEKNSQKSEAEKKSTALIYSFLITFVIALVWLITTIYTFEFQVSEQNVAAVNTIKTEHISPLDSIIKSTRSFFSNF